MTTTPSTRRDIQPLTIEDFGCLVRSGSATRVYISEYTPEDGGGWVVDVDHCDSLQTTKLHTERGSLRVFRTADAAIKALKVVRILTTLIQLLIQKKKLPRPLRNDE